MKKITVAILDGKEDIENILKLFMAAKMDTDENTLKDGETSYTVFSEADLVIINLSASDNSTKGIIESIAEDKNKGKIPVFILSTNAGKEQGIQDGNFADLMYYLVKPFDRYAVHQMSPYGYVREAQNMVLMEPGMAEKYKSYRNILEQYVTDILYEIDTPVHVKGYQYLREAIILCVNDMSLLNLITKVLYPKIAKKYNTTPTSVERAIRHVVEVIWKKGDPQKLEKLFGYKINHRESHPTNSEVIALIADEIRLEYGMLS